MMTTQSNRRLTILSLVGGAVLLSSIFTSTPIVTHADSNVSENNMQIKAVEGDTNPKTAIVGGTRATQPPVVDDSCDVDYELIRQTYENMINENLENNGIIDNLVATMNDHGSSSTHQLELHAEHDASINWTAPTDCSLTSDEAIQEMYQNIDIHYANEYRLVPFGAVTVQDSWFYEYIDHFSQGNRTVINEQRFSTYDNGHVNSKITSVMIAYSTTVSYMAVPSPNDIMEMF